LLRKKFDSRPIFVMGVLAQKAGPIDLVIGRDSPVYLQLVVECIQHPGELLYGKAVPEFNLRVSGESRSCQVGLSEANN
jgi:hypothetical protein